MFRNPNQYFWLLEHLHKNKIAVQYLKDGQVESISYSYLLKLARLRTCELIAKLGDITGKHIAIVRPYSFDYLIDFLAVIIGDGVAVLFNDKEKEDYISYGLELAEIDYIIKDGNVIEQGPCCGKQKEGYKNLSANAAICLILFTSGTMGKPKAVPYTFETLGHVLNPANLSMPGNIRNCIEKDKKFTRDKSLYLMIPLYHIGGASLLIMWFMMGGVINFCFDMKYMYKDLAAMPSIVSVTVPVVLKAWAKDLEKGKNRLGCLKLIGCGAAPVDSHSMEVCRDNNIYVAQSYGLTELGCISNINLLGDTARLNSVGRNISGYKLKILDGEICFKVGKKYLGYYRNQEATSEIYNKGFLKTGDLGQIGRDGELYISGRQKNIILLSSGENINPEEIEGSLETCSLIEDCQVIAEDDHLTALIFTKEKNQQAVRDFIDELNKKQPLYKKISRVHFVEDRMERTALGKIKRG